MNITKTGFTFTFLFTICIIAGYSQVSTVDSLDKSLLNWYNMSPALDKVQGAAVDQAYIELKDKQPGKKVVVAVIDGGVDITHPDLAGKIWVNPGETEGNGVDDDKNGYVDDVNGWNFIGNAAGENIMFENMEYVRIMKELKSRFYKVKNPSNLATSDQADYDLYVRCCTEYDKALAKYTSYKNNIDQLNSAIKIHEATIKEHLQKDKFDKADVQGIKNATGQVKLATDFFMNLYEKGFSFEDLASLNKSTNEYLNYRLNLDFKPRDIIGDNPSNIDDAGYGNGNVKGPRSFHGTAVSGIIAANRGNGFGIDGIASSVQIMVLRVVPDGDERDKDVALAIRYAVDNGANIINMSFGKYYSLHSKLMDDAIRYADSRNVLMIKSAGNEGENLDLVNCYPTNVAADGYVAKNWITVGANSTKLDKHLPAVFSNYSKSAVDVFAPGVDIITSYPEDKYDMASGTSFSGPVVSGVAALVWSYYPALTAAELKEILLSSVTAYPKTKVYLPSIKGGKKAKVRFSELSSTGGIINSHGAIKMAQGYKLEAKK